MHESESATTRTVGPIMGTRCLLLLLPSARTPEGTEAYKYSSQTDPPILPRSRSIDSPRADSGVQIFSCSSSRRCGWPPVRSQKSHSILIGLIPWAGIGDLAFSRPKGRSFLSCRQPVRGRRRRAWRVPR
jgi:hypothetical protein